MIHYISKSKVKKKESKIPLLSILFINCDVDTSLLKSHVN